MNLSQTLAFLQASFCLILHESSTESLVVNTFNPISWDNFHITSRPHSYTSTRTSSWFHHSSCQRSTTSFVYFSTKSNDSFMDEADELFEFMDMTLDVQNDHYDEDDAHTYDIYNDDLIDDVTTTTTTQLEPTITSTNGSSSSSHQIIDPEIGMLNLAPASGIAYFYLKKTVGLSEEDMYLLMQKSGSILGLTVPTLQRKISVLTKSMKLTDDDIRTIINKQPSILTLSANRNISPTILFLVRALDLGKDDLRTIVVQYPCILCYSIQNLQAKIEFFSKTMQYDMEQMRTLLVKEPRLLCAAVETGLRPRMKFLHKEICIPIEDLKPIVQKNPRLLLYSLYDNLQVKLISFFIMRLRMEPKHVLKILKSYPLIMDYSLDNHMLPIARFFLSEIQFSPIEFRGILLKFPRLMTHSTYKIKHVVGYLRYQLGMDAVQVKRVLFQAPQVISLDTEGNLAAKVDFLQDILKLDSDDVRKVITGMPTLLLCSIENNLRPTIDYLHESLGGDETKLRQVVLTLPTLLGYSLENRIRPRMQRIIEIGLDQKIITIGIPMADAKFDKWLDNKKHKIEHRGSMRHKRAITSESPSNVPDRKVKLAEELRKGRIVHWKR